MLVDRPSSGSPANPGPAADAHCAQIADPDRASLDPVYFSGPPEQCDACGRPIACESYFGDCEFPGQGGWGYACATCITGLGLRFGWGKGQLYQRTDEPEPQWQMVAGFPPAGVAG